MQTRRTILVGSAVAALSSLCSAARSQTAPQLVRYGATTPNGKAMLKVYAQGVATMKTWAATNPLAWDFQWYIHATPKNKQTLIGEVFKSAPTSDPNRKLAEQTWYTCQAHQGQPEDYFLPWHRLYVLQFEEIIRAVTGVTDFTLPYWDYTTPSSYSIPVEFQTANSTVPPYQSLFVQDRNKNGGSINSADVNAGEPLNKNFPPDENFLVLPDMGNLDYSSFCSQLDQNLHGAIHVYTGDRTNMGRVPTAAKDPVFWLHHCNIDRIWTAWNVRGRNPTETDGVSWQDTKFVFANAQGQRVEIAIGTVADSANLPYRYDTLPGQPATTAAAGERITVAEGRPAEGRPAMTTILRSSKAPADAAGKSLAPEKAEGVALGAAPQTVRLSPTKPENRLQSLGADVRSEGAARLVLTLNDVQAAADPDTTYQVFLDLPPDTPAQARGRHYVGLLNFFGIGGHGDHGSHGGRTVEFDVTKVVGRLGADKALRDETSVTLVPLGKPADGSNPVVAGGIELRRR